MRGQLGEEPNVFLSSNFGTSYRLDILGDFTSDPKHLYTCFAAFRC